MIDGKTIDAFLVTDSLKADKSKESGTSGARGKRPGSAGGHRDKGRGRLVHT